MRVLISQRVHVVLVADGAAWIFERGGEPVRFAVDPGAMPALIASVDGEAEVIAAATRDDDRLVGGTIRGAERVIDSSPAETLAAWREFHRKCR